ncbi:hypothetical protein PVAND_005462 [Polypedilum vanderplanki]|uniref:DNA repair protein rad9 n=1 Tax=Polypedilum vanderplanki TaxID=319348 RepID=A0A9J6C0Y4_POLVA|nr:hypothetical protein PVAND_005462 [Polypedilum vanderplanki]
MRLIIIKEDLIEFAKVIKFLARSSHEIYMILGQNSMTLKAIDQTETMIIYAKFKNSFFHEYQYDYIKKENWPDPECNPNIFFISAKYLSVALKQYKNFTKCTFSFNNDKQMEKLIIELVHNSGCLVTKQMNLFDILDYSKAETTKYCITDVVKNVYFIPSLIHKYVDNMKKEMDEIKLVFSKTAFHIQNSDIDEDKYFKFNIKIDPSEFITYNIVSDDETSFVIRSNLFFRMIDFAKSLNDTKLNIYFTKTSEPISTVLEMPRFTINAVQATINREGGKYCRKKGTKVTKHAKIFSMSDSLRSILLEDFNFSDVSQLEKLIDENSQVEKLIDENNQAELPIHSSSKFQFKVPAAPLSARSTNVSTTSNSLSNWSMPGTSVSNLNILNQHEFLLNSNMQKTNQNAYNNNNNNNMKHSGDFQENIQNLSNIDNEPIINKPLNITNRASEEQENFATIVDDEIIMGSFMLNSQQSRQNFNTLINTPLNESVFFKTNKPSATSTQQHNFRSNALKSTKFRIPKDLENFCTLSDEEDD